MTRLLLICLGLCLPAAASSSGVTGASAQPEDARGPADAPAALTEPQRLALAIERLALIDLRMRPVLGPEDYLVLDTMLGFAQEFNPADARLARRRAEAAFRMNDRDALLARTRDIVRLDPFDTTAQLRLITLQVDRLQTAPGRLAAYDRFLGRAGQAIDPSVRSRLALDAALLAREMGDDAGFTKRLSVATRLDSSNKEAAALASLYVATRLPDDRLASLEMASNLLMADPVDPNLHFAMASELSKNGAYAQAERFHANARYVRSQDATQEPSESIEIERYILMWYNDGPQAAHKAMMTELEYKRYLQRILIDQMTKAGVPTTDTEKPEDIRLGLQTERLRMLAADAAEDRTGVAESIADYARTVERIVNLLNDKTRRPSTMTDADAASRIYSMLVERLIIHAWTGVGLQDMVDQLRDSPLLSGEKPDPVSLAWASFALEAPEQSVKRFQDLLADHSLARVGLALAYERAGSTNAALEQYRILTAQFPISVAAAWARSRAMRLGAGDITRTDITPRAEAIAQAVPAWVDLTLREPWRLLSIGVEAAGDRIGALDPVLLDITIRNNTPIPLGLGADRPIVSRLLLAPSIDSGIDTGGRAQNPEVVEVNQRLRLGPGEELKVKAWGDAGFSGLSAEVATLASSRGRFRVIQGFTIVLGALGPGPMCQSAESRPFTRLALPEATLPVSELASRILNGTDGALRDALGALRLLALEPGANAVELEPAVLGAAQRYAGADEATRCLMLAMLPHAGLAPALAAFDESVRAKAASETSPRVLGLFLLTRTTGPADPVLDLPAVRAHAALAPLVSAMRARLGETGPTCIARATILTDLATAPEQSGPSDERRRKP